MAEEITECKSPICQNPIRPLVPENGKKVWYRSPRRFCSDQCRMDHWTLRRVAVMLSPLGSARAWGILQDLKNGGSEGRGLGQHLSLWTILRQSFRSVG